jgi:serine/threonine protein kinase
MTTYLIKWKGTLLEENWATYPDVNTLRDIQGLNQNKLAFDLLCKMVEYDPTKRITASEALDHPYFKEEPLPGMKYVILTWIIKLTHVVPCKLLLSLGFLILLVLK